MTTPLTDLIPDGVSYRVSANGEYRQYKTLKGAQKRVDELLAEGKTPVLSEYNRGVLTNILGGK